MLKGLVASSAIAVATVFIVNIASAGPPARQAASDLDMPLELRGKVLHTIVEREYKFETPTSTQETELSWWEIAADGSISRAYVVVTSTDGTVKQQGFFRDGAVYNYNTARDVLTVTKNSPRLEVFDFQARGFEGFSEGPAYGDGVQVMDRKTAEVEERFYIFEGVRIGFELRDLDESGTVEAFHVERPLKMEVHAGADGVFDVPLPVASKIVDVELVEGAGP